MAGCDYTGRVGSVEAHISGSQSGGHRGEFGADRRAELVEQAEEELNGGGRPPVEATKPGDVTETGEGDDTSSSGAMETGGEPTSAGAKMPPSKALIGASVLFALAAFTGSSGGTSDADAGENSGEPDGGLLE